jgi:hypothetical protein
MGKSKIGFWAKFVILTGMLVGLPLLGLRLSGSPLAPYLEFPPTTRYVRHAPFSIGAYIALSAVILMVVCPFAVNAWKSGTARPKKKALKKRRAMAWWGWPAMASLLAAWYLAWNRFDWVGSLQAHTFTPLWLSFILVANALSRQRTGTCLMLARPLFFVLLFPMSAIFWWFFEYLNRFVQNWFYVGPEFSPWSYFWYATLPFSTVLPAVLSIAWWIERSAWIQNGFKSFLPITALASRMGSAAAMGVAAVGLTLIGVFPNLLFPLLWVSPLLIIGAMQTLAGERSLLSEIGGGDWRRAVAAAVAALICGLHWEMWNIYSLAKWKYSIPLVHRCQIFEMPVLGYAGYLPFGLECVIVADMLMEGIQRTRSRFTG